MLHITPISQAMTKRVLTLDPNDCFDRAERIFKKYNFHQIPIVDKKAKLVGVISNVRYHKLCDRYSLFSKALGESIDQSYFVALPVSEVMNSSPLYLNENNTLDEAVRIFRENIYHSLPVINDTFQLTGIISILDVLNFLQLELEKRDAYVGAA